MTKFMSLFLVLKKFLTVLVISSLLWVGIMTIYWIALADDWTLPLLIQLRKSMPYILSLFELITSVGFAVVFYWLYHELKLLPDKTFERIKYKTMTYLTLITMLTNTRFLYAFVLELNNSLTAANEHDFDAAKLLPSYLSELLQCIFVLWHIFSNSLPKSNNGQMTDERTAVFVIESDLEYSTDVRRSYGRNNKGSILKYSSNNLD